MAILRLLRGLALASLLVAAPGCISVDNREQTTRAAKELAHYERSALWGTPSGGRSADVVAFLATDQVLIGEVEGGSTFGEASFGPVRLLNLANGQALWSASRETSIDAVHVLLADTPKFLFLTSELDGGELWALEPGSGKRAWSHDLGEQAQARITAEGARVIVLSRDGSDGVLEAFETSSGRRVWKREVVGAGLELTLTDGVALVSGARVHAFDAASGQPRWATAVAGLGDDYHRVLASPSGVAVWTGRGVAGLDEKGQVRWTCRAERGSVQRVVQTESTLYRLVRDADPLSGEALEAIDNTDGSVRWRADLLGQVTGPLTIHDGQVLLVLEDALLGLKADSGREVFRTGFPVAYAMANPTSAEHGGVPDEVARRAGLLVIDRAEQGLRAYRLPGGEEAWTTDAFPDRLSVARCFSAMLAGVQAAGGGLAPSGMRMVDWSGPNRNLLVEQQQARHDQVMHQTSRVLADRTSTAGERRGAIESRRLQTQVDTARVERQIAHERTLAKVETGLATAQAVLVIGQAFAKAYEQDILSSLATRARVNWRWSLRARAGAFQGGSHLSGFTDTSGTGVRIVNLETGEVDELRFEPPDPLQKATRVPTEVFGLSPDGSRLVLIGLGLDSSRYESTSETNLVLRLKGIKASILCYDPRQKKPTPNGRSAPDPFAGMIFDTMKQASLLGHAPSLRILINKGEDPEQTILFSDPGTKPTVYNTPLRLAAQGHPDAVKLLLDVGVKPTRLDLPGFTAMDIASEERDAFYTYNPAFVSGRPAVRKLLEAAGAQRRETTPAKHVGGGTDDAARDVPLTGAHLFRLRHAIRQGDAWKHEPVIRGAIGADRSDVARALLERGADPNAGAAVGGTALHAAATKRNVEILRLLLKYKADPNAGRNSIVGTPLAQCLNPFTPATQTLHEVVKLLLEAGADPNAPVPQQFAATNMFASLLECAEKIDGDLGDLLEKHGAR